MTTEPWAMIAPLDCCCSDSAKLWLERTELNEADVAWCLSGGGAGFSPPAAAKSELLDDRGGEKEPLSVDRERAGGREKEVRAWTRAGGL